MKKQKKAETAVALRDMPQEKQISVMQEKTQSLQERVESVDISNEQEVKMLSQGIRAFKKMIEDAKDELVAPAKQIIERAKFIYDGNLFICKQAEATLKDRNTQYVIEQRRKQEEEKMKLAERVERGTMKAETAVKKMENMDEVKKTSGGLTVKTKKDIEVVDETKVPEKYWIKTLNTKLIREEALANDPELGKSIVPGVNIVEVTSSAFSRS